MFHSMPPIYDTRISYMVTYIEFYLNFNDHYQCIRSIDNEDRVVGTTSRKSLFQFHEK